MRINRIKLNNFGSYEGENIFETKVNENQNIVLIGGKNGAGKTTLFTAMRLCLYGFLSMGYKSANSYYNRAVIKLINNNSKMSKPCIASVLLEIELNNGRGIDTYLLVREWTLNDTLSEKFSVYKNNCMLDKEETANFENFLLSLIPPELFNLYFFDGEKISDFFMSEGGNSRIKEAFLTLCGYDTFEIMRRNFKRISSSCKGKTQESLTAYIEAKEHAKEEREKLESINKDLMICTSEIENCDADIITLDNSFSNSGGITQEEWNQKIFLLKEEERKRENWNALLRKWANDVIPYIMVYSILERVKDQIQRENNDNKYRSFIEIINNHDIAELIGDKRKEIETIVYKKMGAQESGILDLSFEQSADLLSTVSELLSFDRNKIAKAKRLIKQSIDKSTKLRKELEQSNISTVQEYMRKRAELFEKKSILLNQQIELEQCFHKQKEIVTLSSDMLLKTQITLEEEIKNESIGDISARAIIMIDKLQSSLFSRQIKKVEIEFMNSINKMMRKTRFIDDIYIDDNFCIHVFRKKEFTGKELKVILSVNSEEQFVSMFGDQALECLKNIFGKTLFNDIVYRINDKETYVLPLEIDKESFSNGEKQIFIMSLYFALVKLGNHEIPFVIDTPFARIDTEHRFNIAKYFFSELRGQIFILSTNEELTNEHIKILSDKIQSQYMLENTDNKKTAVIKDSYFEV